MTNLHYHKIITLAIFWLQEICTVNINLVIHGKACSHILITDHDLIKENCETFKCMMEVVSSPETSVNIYQTTWCYIPEDSHLLAINQADEKFWVPPNIKSSNK
jgi:hypothetical protein